MKKNKTLSVSIAIASLSLVLPGCAELPFAVPAPNPLAKQLGDKPPAIPGEYPRVDDQASSGTTEWQEFFKDERLASLIDSALQNNQELNIMLQEIEISKAEVLRRKGAYLPFITLGTGAEAEKVGQYTRRGAVEENLDVKEGRNFPEPLGDFRFAAEFSWEVDVWKKLRNDKKAPTMRFLATREGRNFMITNLVAEIASSYYELMALDNQLTIVTQMVDVQQNALGMIRLEKQAARVTELAVQRFEAEVAKNQSRLYEIKQQIVVTENRINFLAGRYPQPIERPSDRFEGLAFDPVHPGSPADLLSNRPDVRQAELELVAAKLDVKAARARFYPRLDIAGAVGFEAYALRSLFTAPESLLYNIAAELMVPLINKSQIRAAYNGASAEQIAAIYRYQQVVLNAYVEVLNQLSQINNINQSYDLKAKQVSALSRAIEVAIQLFRSARADYTEVLLTQRDALESRIELVDLKQQQANALVRAYRALGGGFTHGAREAEDHPPST
ncbi:TolC family protein [Myxococcota bacterium]|nr:TolC family protein [Myxococcota bacterium]